VPLHHMDDKSVLSPRLDPAHAAYLAPSFLYVRIFDLGCPLVTIRSNSKMDLNKVVGQLDELPLYIEHVGVEDINGSLLLNTNTQEPSSAFTSFVIQSSSDKF
jgi:hypothetical protein